MSVLSAKGFRASGTAAGIKPDGSRDMALVVAEGPAAAAAVFTTSLTAAPPVQLSRRNVAGGVIQAIAVNSGGANAGTGLGGLEDAEATAEAVARAVGCDPGAVVVCSTGAIGGRLPMDRILAGVDAMASGLGTSSDHAEAAAEGILTTDSVTKTCARSSDGWTIGGMAKGAGMLRPDMATMLAFLTTDAVLDAGSLHTALREAVDVSFNSLNVDGCQSTNDTVVLLASGASGVAPDPDRFASELEAVCRDLALKMAQDAEGASRVVRLRVGGAPDDRSARRLGAAVADSALVRSSFYGADPNWGRIVAALGVAGVPLDPAEIAVAYDGTVVCRGGVGIPVDEDELSARLAGDFDVDIEVGSGSGSAEVVTTDLTPDYVIFNGERS